MSQPFACSKRRPHLFELLPAPPSHPNSPHPRAPHPRAKARSSLDSSPSSPPCHPTPPPRIPYPFMVPRVWKGRRAWLRPPRRPHTPQRPGLAWVHARELCHLPPATSHPAPTPPAPLLPAHLGKGQEQLCHFASSLPPHTLPPPSQPPGPPTTPRAPRQRPGAAWPRPPCRQGALPPCWRRPSGRPPQRQRPLPGRAARGRATWLQARRVMTRPRTRADGRGAGAWPVCFGGGPGGGGMHDMAQRPCQPH